jgi:N-acetylmuramoyl-L-alanine amidase
MKFATAFAVLAFAVTAPAQFSGRRFVIDPGHGGTDPGAVESTAGPILTRRISCSISPSVSKRGWKRPERRCK